MNRHLTEEQARKLREALSGHDLEAILTLALATGMRRDELLCLKWQDLDLEKRELHVRDTKTQGRDWTIYLPEDITDILKQHALHQAEARLEGGTAGSHLDLVFPDRNGEVLRPERLLKAFHELLVQAGLPPLHFHELRLARLEELYARLRAAKERLDNTQAGELDLNEEHFP